MTGSFLFVNEFFVMLKYLRKYIEIIDPDKLNVENWLNLMKFLSSQFQKSCFEFESFEFSSVQSRFRVGT